MLQVRMLVPKVTGKDNGRRSIILLLIIVAVIEIATFILPSIIVSTRLPYTLTTTTTRQTTTPSFVVVAFVPTTTTLPSQSILSVVAASISTKDSSSSSSSLYLFSGRKNKKESEESDRNNNNKNNNSITESSSTTTDNMSCVIILEIIADNIKIGPLRFLLNLYLLGEQNNPNPKTWLIRQTDNKDNELQVYYTDVSAMLQIELDSNKMIMKRYGTSPSLQYIINESSLIHNILDELEIVAYGTPTSTSTTDTTNVTEEPKIITNDKRLLLFSDISVLQQARAKISIQRAKTPT